MRGMIRGGWAAGSVPVRFDPGNHSAVVLDLPALAARHQQEIAADNAARKRADDEKIARAQARIEGRAGACSPTSPPPDGSGRTWP